MAAVVANIPWNMSSKILALALACACLLLKEIVDKVNLAFSNETRHQELLDMTSST